MVMANHRLMTTSGGAAHESRGRPECCVHHERAKERLPQLVGVRRPGESTAGTPSEQERNECQAKWNEGQ